jgi:hypothetical protein
MHRLTIPMKRIALLFVLAIFVLGGLTACVKSSSGTKATAKESKSQQDTYAKLVALDPAHTMDYSPTRKTINFWIDTWSKPGKLAYVYLQNSNGDLLGYYVLQGPPVSMCTSLTPNYKLVDPGGSNDNGNIVVPAPGVDGVYYSGGECNTYYGKDANTGAYIEYTVGLGINVLLYDQPLTNHPNVANLSPSGK